MTKYNNKNAGFTLLELLIAMVIAGIIAGFALPSMIDTVLTAQVSSASNTINGLIRFARSQAASQGSAYLIGAADANNWAKGVVIWTETDANNTYNSGTDTLIRRGDFPERITITETISGQKFIRFTGQGYALAAATLDVCDSKRHGEQGRTISIIASGFSTMKTKGAPCD